MSINKAFLSGNVGTEPQVKEFERGGNVVSFSLATTERGFKTQNGTEIPDRTEWHNIVINNGKNLAQYIHKGDKISIVGKIRYREYEKDGQKRTVTEIIADEVELAAKPKQANDEAAF